MNKEEDMADKESEYKTSIVIRTVTRIMAPFIFMFGISIIFHGHLTPGGGFQGGVIIGASLILIGIAFNKEEGRKAAPRDFERVVISSGLSIYIITGLVGMIFGYSFLTNGAIKFPPLGELGELFSGGTLFWINIGIGLLVSGIAIELFFAFLEETRDPSYNRKVKVLDKKRRWSDGVSKDSTK